MKRHILPFFILLAFVLLGNNSLQAQKLLEKPVIDNVVVVFDWDTYLSTISDVIDNVTVAEAEENICTETEGHTVSPNSNEAASEDEQNTPATSDNDNQTETESPDNADASEEPLDEDTGIILQTADAMSLAIDKIHPNPANDLVNISVSDLSAANLRLINLAGQQVAQWNKPQSQKMVISVANIPAGFYLLHIQQEGKTTVHKLEVNH